MNKTIYTAADLADKLGAPTPTDEQARVIEYGVKDPLLVVAGAGSGKTATMSARVVYLVANGIVRPEQILGLTFTRKAAGELSARIAAQLDTLAETIPDLAVSADQGVEVATYNAFASSLVKEFGVHIGADPASRLIGEAESHQIVSTLVEERAGDLDLPGELSPATVVSAVTALSEQLSNHQVLPGRDLDYSDPQQVARLVGDAVAQVADDVREEVTANKLRMTNDLKQICDSLEVRASLMSLVADYAAYKRDHQMLDFSDQISLVRQLVTIPEVCQTVRRRYQAVFLDEFQDTSDGQVEFLSALFGGMRVTAVGDPNQAIYAWRGASQAALHGFHENFGGTDSLTLSTAWRNDKAILDVANTVAAPCHERPEYWTVPKERASVPTVELKPREGAGQGVVYGGEFAAAVDEAQAIAEYVESQGDQLGTCAILFRSRKHIPLVAAALRDREIPVLLDRAGLLTEPAVLDVCAALELTADASRGDVLMRLLTNVGIGTADIELLWQWAREQAKAVAPESEETDDSSHSLPAFLLDAVDSPPEVGWMPETFVSGEGFSAAARVRVERLGDQLRELRHHSTEALPRLVERAIAVLDCDVDSQANPDTPMASRVLEEFVSVAVDYDQATTRPTLRGFLAWVEAAREQERGLAMEPAPTSPDAVVLTTVHSAKGLEWDTVFVPFLAEGIFPAAPRGHILMATREQLPPQARGDEGYLPHLDFSVGKAGAVYKAYKQAEIHRDRLEERRLAYVAFTRARQRLILTTSWYPSAGGASSRQPAHSAFLPDLDTLTPLPISGPTRMTAEGAAEVVAERNAAQADGVAWTTPRIVTPMREVAAQIEARDAAWQPLTKPLDDQRILDAVSGRIAPDDEATRLLAEGARLPQTDLLGQVARVLAEDAAAHQRDSVALPGRLTTTTVATLGDPERLPAYLDELRRPMPPEPTAATEFGSRFHEAMATILSGLANGGNRADLEALVAQNLAEVEDTEVAEVTDLVAQTLDMGLLERYEPRQVEYDVATVIGQRVLAARLDALMWDTQENRWAIVDWKTNRPGTSRRVPPAYVAQLQIYRLALADMWGIDPAEVGMRLVFVRDRAVVDVEACSRASAEDTRRALEQTLERAEAQAQRVYLA
ncbi:MAG: ATP-dependent DNA helicase [Actinomycetaceae bacterium]|nr:ATP-dependent DNA helicase [Actinomycetaceae bacterium]MDU0970195.1 ATP-dependent DNA helicase [Actinomycetaceae bacterium]